MRMKWVLSGAFVLAAFCAVLAYGLGYVPDAWPSVKGIHLGMNEAELKTILPDRRKLTIAGSKDAQGKPGFRFEEGKLAEFRFNIPEGAYAAVRDAIKGKYPQMRCRLMLVNIPGRAPMPHEECQWGALLIVQSILGQDVDPDRVVLTHTPNEETQGWMQDVQNDDV